jgi:hypothetical protein
MVELQWKQNFFKKLWSNLLKTWKMNNDDTPIVKLDVQGDLSTI